MWAELERRGGLSDQKIKTGTFVKIEKLSFWESPVKICDVVGTPIISIGRKYYYQYYFWKGIFTLWNDENTKW